MSPRCVSSTRLLGPVAGALLAAACGTDVPPIDQVKQDFESPSASVADKESVMTANAKRVAANPATTVAGNGAVFGQGLTAIGKARGLERIQASSMFASEIRQLKALVDGRKDWHLHAESASAPAACTDETAVNEAMLGLFADLLVGKDELTGSFSYEVDLGECTQILTGSMSVDGEIAVTKNSFTFTIEQHLSDACEKQGQMACVDGDFVIEVAASGDGAASSLSSVSFVSAWFAEATWQQDGQEVSAQTKGGLRLSASAAGGSMEYLFYFKTRDGVEKSFVMTIEVGADGAATLTIRGTDGELSCSVGVDGAGTCDGKSGAGAEFAWDATEHKKVATDEALLGF